MASLAAGTRLGTFEVLERIGVGGMSEVYRARDTSLDRLVALKVLLPDRAADPEFRERFAREARAASALNHPNIVTIYQVGRTGDRDWLAMELVDGVTLDTLLAQASLSAAQTIRYGADMAAALAVAHQAGIVHRDLKPGNVMLTRSGLVKIVDFGLAKVGVWDTATPDSDTRTMEVTAPTVSGKVIGTAAYMSPEQAEGHAVDARSDVFSFGALLYAMLTGQSPFQRGSTVSTLAAVLRDDPEPLQSRVPDVPPLLAAIVSRCLRKRPEDRFQSAADLRITLNELVDAPRGTAALSLFRQLRWVSWAALVLLAVLGGALWSRFGGKPPGPPPEPKIILSLQNRAFGPSLSPDGERVAFSWEGEAAERPAIYVASVSSGKILASIDGGGERLRRLSPRWSPDGRWLAYFRVQPGEPADLIVAPAEGGAERTVLSFLPTEVDAPGLFSAFRLCWALNGKSIYAAVPSDDRRGFVLALVDVASGRVQPLTDAGRVAGQNDVDPALSHDGSRIAFVRRQHSLASQVLVMEVEPDGRLSGEARSVYEGAVRSGLAWAPDNESLLISRDAGTGLLRVSLAAGADPPRVVDPNLTYPSLVRARDGFRLIGVRPLLDDNLWRIPLDDPRGVPLRVAPSPRREFEPRFGPDRNDFIFTSSRAGRNQLWQWKDGRAIRLTEAQTSGARWSPDGRLIVFISYDYSQQEIEILDPATGRRTRITDNPAHETSPAWAPDGRYLYFGSNRTGRFQIWKTEAKAGAEPVPITTNGGYAALPTSDGLDLLYVDTNRPGAPLRVLTFATGRDRVLPVKVNFWGNFDVVGRRVYFVNEDNELGVIDLETSHKRILRSLPSAPGFGLGVARDERSAVFTSNDNGYSELVLFESYR